MLPLSPTPDAPEQCRIIRDLLQRTKILPNSEGFLISAKWFKNWKDHVGFNGPANFFKVNPIDNKCLLSDNQVKDDLKVHVDYEVVPETVFSTLHEWYGGGPVLKRNVEHDPVHDCNVVVINPPTFDIYYNDDHQTFEFSLYQPIKDLKRKACESFHITNMQSRARLCDYFMKVCQTELNDERCLEYYAIPPGSQLILQVQNEDGTWPETIDSKNQEYWTRLDRSDPGMHGFLATPNGCYVNVVLQCLSHSQPLINYFTGSDWKLSLNLSNKRGTKGRLAEAFAGIVRDMWTSKIPVLSPRIFKNTIGDQVEIFKGDNQGDVHELITYTLDLLSEDLNRSNELIEGSVAEGTLDNEQEVAKSSWECHTKFQDSYIVENFHGLFRSRVECQKCHHTAVSFDPYSTISLAIPIPLQNTAPFTFIPWDLKKPRILMQLKLNNPTLLTEVIDGICHRMKRQMNIIFAEYHQHSIELKWLKYLEPSSRDIKIIAFELPPHKPDAIFAQVRLMAPVTNANRKTQKEIDPFCLVQLPPTILDGNSEAIIQEECEKRFDPLFSPCKGEVTNPKIKDIIDKLYPPQPNDEDFATRLKAKIYSRSYEKTVKFERDPTVTIVTTRRIDVRLNSAIISDPTKFEWTALQNIENTIETPTDFTHSNIFTLKECLDNFIAEDQLDEKNLRFCPYCQENSKCAKKMDLWSAPKVLILHLKRYQCNIYSTKKLTEKVTYPDILDLSSYIVGPDQDKDNMKYKLYAIIEHFGGLDSGHYETIILQDQKDKWFKYNDQLVQIIKKEKAHSQNAYVLFYVRIDE
ncbi:hypothetical protein M9Y10_045088 [Tritrichomonas musculus]|uniref:ubiquitinyl hydrolase 1 n=1 Tax=Tritrichomonas musculus TaxID=1915356 RepID=A0ABR2JUA4_9EUKA